MSIKIFRKKIVRSNPSRGEEVLNLVLNTLSHYDWYLWL